jgi:hypothetical protein
MSDLASPRMFSGQPARHIPISARHGLRIVELVLTSDDYRAAIRLFAKSARRSPFLRRPILIKGAKFGLSILAGAVFAIAVMISFHLLEGLPKARAFGVYPRVMAGMAGVSLIGALLFGAWLWIRLLLSLDREVRAQRGRQWGPATIRFGWSRSRIGSFGEAGSRIVPLAMLNGWDDDDVHIVLYPDTGSFLPLPLRHLSEEELADLRLSLQEGGVKRGWHPPVFLSSDLRAQLSAIFG